MRRQFHRACRRIAEGAEVRLDVVGGRTPDRGVPGVDVPPAG